jgi:hypothetical protein
MDRDNRGTTNKSMVFVLKKFQKGISKVLAKHDWRLSEKQPKNYIKPNYE